MNHPNIRRLTENELHDSIMLSSFAFQYEVGPEELERRREQQRPDRIWGWFEDGRLCAKAAVHPLRIWLNGRKVPMGGVASVATWPEFRRQGLVRQLLTHVMGEMRDEGLTVSILHPFSVPFYRKFGWEVIADAVSLELEPAKCRGFEMRGAMRRVERPLEELALLQRLYAAYAARFNAMLDRDAAWWEQRVLKEEPLCYVYEDSSGEPKGYMLYKLKQRVMTVAEWVYLNREAREGMLAFIANHDSMADTVKLRCSATDRLPYLMSDPRVKQDRWAYCMGRIIDIQAFTAVYAFRSGEQESRLGLSIADMIAPWNHGDFVLHIDRSGQGGLEPAGQQAGAVTCECSIQALTAMLFGYVRPASLYEDGFITGDAAAIAQLEARIPAVQTNLIDYY
jgi:predicted acetyltransferase